MTMGNKGGVLILALILVLTGCTTNTQKTTDTSNTNLLQVPNQTAQVNSTAQQNVQNNTAVGDTQNAIKETNTETESGFKNSSETVQTNMGSVDSEQPTPESPANNGVCEITEFSGAISEYCPGETHAINNAQIESNDCPKSCDDGDQTNGDWYNFTTQKCEHSICTTSTNAMNFDVQEIGFEKSTGILTALLKIPNNYIGRELQVCTHPNKDLYPPYSYDEYTSACYSATPTSDKTFQTSNLTQVLDRYYSLQIYMLRLKMCDATTGDCEFIEKDYEYVLE